MLSHQSIRNLVNKENIPNGTRYTNNSQHTMCIKYVYAHSNERGYGPDKNTATPLDILVIPPNSHRDLPTLVNGKRCFTSDPYIQ